MGLEFYPFIFLMSLPLWGIVIFRIKEHRDDKKYNNNKR